MKSILLHYLLEFTGFNISTWKYVYQVELDSVFLSRQFYVLNEQILLNCKNLKDLLARNKPDIWKLSDCNWIRTHSHLIGTQTLYHMASLGQYKWLSIRFQNCAYSNLWISGRLVNYIVKIHIIHVCDMTKTHSPYIKQKRSHNTAQSLRQVWLNGWMLVGSNPSTVTWSK